MSNDGPVALVLLALLFVFALFMCNAAKGWNNECRAKGGHVVRVYKAKICVSSDGRILE